MTREILLDLEPREVLERAKRFFTGPDSGYAGGVDGDGPGFVRFRAFRGILAVTAVREGGEGGREAATRVRISTLRSHPSIPLFLTLLQGESSHEGAARS